MSKIKPVVGDQYATSYHLEDSPQEKIVENFLWKLLILTALAYFVWSEKITINIGPLSIRKTELEKQFSKRKGDILSILGISNVPQYGVPLEDENIDNLTFVIDPSFAERHGVDAGLQRQSMQQCSLFIKQFSPVAIAEMRRYGVPASILLAQALLASNAGEDSLSIMSNNYFRRECGLKKCKSNHFPEQKNLENPALMDIFPNLWGSFRAQSLYFIHTASYAPLFQPVKKDFRVWAYGLAAGKYSKDEQYAEKLIALIYSLQLNKLDERD